MDVFTAEMWTENVSRGTFQEKNSRALFFHIKKSFLKDNNSEWMPIPMQVFQMINPRNCGIIHVCSINLYLNAVRDKTTNTCNNQN